MVADFYLLLRPLCQKVRQLDAPAKLKVEMTREPATVNNEMTPELATVNNVLYCVGCSTLDVFLYLCFSRVGISSGSLSEPPFSLIEKMFKVEGNSFVCNVIFHCLCLKPTQRAWSSGMPSPLFSLSCLFFSPLFSLFLAFCHSFSFFATFSPASCLPPCLCLLQSGGAEVNCLSAKQTAVAITGSETENAQMLIDREQTNYSRNNRFLSKNACVCH